MSNNKNNLKITIDKMCTIESESAHQYEFLETYHKYDVHLLLGFPGTGKTFLALYRALESVLDRGNRYEKVLIIRSAVPSRDIGFTPGDKEEKGALYERPYIKMCKDLFNNWDSYSRLKEQKVLEYDLSSFLRGDTYDRTIIIADEIQNMSYVELKTIITRVGIDSKAIFCGDIGQNDLGNKSGYSSFVSKVKRMPSSHTVLFNDVDDIVRGGIVREFIIAEIEDELA